MSSLESLRQQLKDEEQRQQDALAQGEECPGEHAAVSSPMLSALFSLFAYTPQLMAEQQQQHSARQEQQVAGPGGVSAPTQGTLLPLF